MSVLLNTTSSMSSVTGTVVDSTTNEPLKGIKVTDSSGKSKRGNNKGVFEIEIPVLSDTTLDPLNYALTITKSKYAQQIIIPYTSTKDVKSNLGIISLTPLESNLKQETSDLLSLNDSEIEEYSLKDATIEFRIQKNFNTNINDLKKAVIPLVLSLISEYGLTKVQELLEEVKLNGGSLTENIKQQITCPPQEKISQIIARKNKLVQQINNVLNSINNTSNIIQSTEISIGSIGDAYQILKNLPTPSAVAGVGLPISIINNIQDVKTFLLNFIEKSKINIGGLSSILQLLVRVLNQVIGFLNFLDLITQFCFQELDLPQEQIAKELTALTQQQSNQLSPVVTNVNGFKMGVETENTTQNIKRRRATAQNKQGVVMLQGEWSFSSIDQILIDELVFYIQQNNLKAD
jgi:hypothetical protein